MLLPVTESKKSKSRRRATYQDVLDAPEHMVAEIVDGELFLSPRPATPHAGAHVKLIFQLGELDEGGRGAGGWRIYHEPELHFRNDIVVPDIAAWRIGRMPNKPTGAYITLAPDWICEVLSPSTWRLDREKKLKVYARERIKHAWLVDALKEQVEVLALEGSSMVLQATYGASDRMRAEPFDAIDIDLAYLWS